MAQKPVVTINMFVFNEEKYMAGTIQSILNQTYGDFKLDISNNGSTDSSGKIAEKFAQQDARVNVIHYKDNDPALGLKMIGTLDSTYYIGIAGHDLYAPLFIERCVVPLEADPQVVLSYPKAMWLKDNKIIGEIPSVFETRGMHPVVRPLVVALGLAESYQQYGIYRVAALKQIKGRDVVGADHVLLTELATIGTFALVNEPLFYMRQADDYGNAVIYRKKHLPNEVDGIKPFMSLLGAYMSIADKISAPVDKDFLKIALFTGCFLRYNWILSMFGESMASTFARPDFHDLADGMSNTVRLIEQKLQSEYVEKSLSSMQSAIAPAPLVTRKAKVKIAGEAAEGKDLTKIQEGSEFETGLRELVLSIKPRSVIETGTYIGTGTTRIIATALRDAGLIGTTFYSIECNPDHHKRALFNLGQAGLLPYVKPLLGLSVPRAILPTVEKIYDDTVQNIAGDDIFVDHQEQNRVALYYREADFPDIPEDFLGTCLAKFGNRPDLILLDSAGHMGSVEFNYVIERLQGECYLVLDDIHHVKHHKSFQQIKSDPRFKLLTSSREKFGFCIAKFTPANELVADIKSILWLRADSIGDNILASSMLPHIKEKYPHAKTTVLCQDHIAELYESSPFVDAVIGFDRLKGYQDEAYRNHIVQKLQAVHADLALNSLYSRDPLYDLFTINSEARTSVAFNGNLCNISADVRDKNNKLYTKVITENEEHKPELERHRNFLEGIGISVSKLEPAIWLKAEDEEFAEKFLKDNNLAPESTVSLFAGAQNNVRIYQSYGLALSDICKSYGLSVIGLGGSSDSAINIQNLEATGVRTINLSGKTTLRQTAAILKRCRLAVGAETGLAHMACAVGAPNIILLGGGHFGRFMPYSPLTSIVCLPLECYNCNWQCKYDRVHCIKDINPEVIAEAVRQTLEKKSEKPRVFVQGTSLWENNSEQPRWQSFHNALNVADVEIIPVGDIPSFTAGIWEKLRAMDRTAQGHFLKEAANEFNQHGEKLFSYNDFEGAELSFSRALELQNNFPKALNNLGVLYAQSGDNGKALQHYEAAVMLQPDNTTFIKSLADFYYVVQKDTKKALQMYEKGLSINPEEIVILMTLGKISIENGRFESAKNFCQRVLEINPKNNDATEIIDFLSNKNRVIRSEQADATALEVFNQSAGYLVSAIVSAYKSERFIRGCIEDLESQTIAARLEIVIVDSCSPQNERAIVEEFQKKYSNIKYIRTETRETVYAAWNRGIKASSGKYITNANTDDRHRHDAFEIMVNELERKPEITLVYADVIMTEKENKP